MVELFAAARLTSGPRTSQVRFRLSPARKLPTPARLNALREREPPGQDYATFVASPALVDDGLGQNSSQGMSASPPLMTGTRAPSDRIVRLLAPKCLTYNVSRRSGLLDEASVEHGELLSQYHALRADRVTGGESVPLARLVRPSLPGAVACRSPSCLSPFAR